jgi:hypothetical protein
MLCQWKDSRNLQDSCNKKFSLSSSGSFLEDKASDLLPMMGSRIQLGKECRYFEDRQSKSQLGMKLELMLHLHSYVQLDNLYI